MLSGNEDASGEAVRQLRFPFMGFCERKEPRVADTVAMRDIEYATQLLQFLFAPSDDDRAALQERQTKPINVGAGDAEFVQGAGGRPRRSWIIRPFLFFGASGLTVDGPNDFDSRVTWIVRRMIEQAQSVVLLVDHYKFGEMRLERICPLTDIDIIVTDRQPDAKLYEAMQTAGVELIVATQDADTGAEEII
ncbi:hypothetical protein BH10PSE7_BH10PSE7_39200 [soil metagenome]